MARHAQPREVAELKGAHKKDPQRYRGEVLKADKPIGQPYLRMRNEAKEVWKELTESIPPGVLTVADRQMFKVLCNLIAEYDDDPSEFAVGKYTHLIGLSARFGMTSSDRQKFITEKPKDVNPFSDLMN